MISKAVIVFLKVPEKGKVKTRLSKSFDNDFVVNLYKGFVLDTLAALQTTAEIKLYFWPSNKEEILREWLGNGYAFCRQKGEDLGQRMANAFGEMFNSGYDTVLLLGTDIPEITHHIIELAFKELKTHDAVIGPSSDGGYYLIGFDSTGFSSEIFQDIQWSTRRVFNQTMSAVDKTGLRCKCLPELNDIDTREDLKMLADQVRKGRKIGKRTHKILTPVLKNL